MLVKREHIDLGPNVRYIDLSHGYEAIIDSKHWEWVSRYSWHVRNARGCHYAIRKVISGGREFQVSMHRMLMHTRKVDVVHHIDRNGMNNTEGNMINMSRREHTEIHRFI